MRRAFKWMLWGLAGLFVLALFRGPPPESDRPQKEAHGKPWETAVVAAQENVVPAAVDRSARIVGDAIGCTSRQTLDDIGRLQVDGDADAAKWMLLAGIARGECRVFYSGDAVYLVETALFSGLVSVRPRGEVTAYWTNIERVKTR